MLQDDSAYSFTVYPCLLKVTWTTMQPEMYFLELLARQEHNAFIIDRVHCLIQEFLSWLHWDFKRASHCLFTSCTVPLMQPFPGPLSKRTTPKLHTQNEIMHQSFLYSSKFSHASVHGYFVSIGVTFLDKGPGEGGLGGPSLSFFKNPAHFS